MKIIESYIQGKQGRSELCEDGYVVTDHFAAVVDGSTSKVGAHGGREAMRLTLDAIRGLPPAADKEEVLRRLTAAVAPHNPPQAATQAAYRLTCSAVLYSRHWHTVWLIGDCQCRLSGHTYTHPKLVDRVLTEARCEAVRYLLEHGASPAALRRNDLGRAFIMDALREQTNFQNDPNPRNPFRYPVIDGFPVDPAAVPAIPVGEATFLVLASDGYPVLHDTLQETEAELHRLLEADPLCIGPNAATKCWMEGTFSFDDRAYLSLRL